MLLNPFDKEKYPFCYSGHQYALDVVSSKIPSCKYVLGTCLRYLNDLDKYSKEEFPLFYFDSEKAERYLRLVQKFKHVKGSWKTPNIQYEPWQNFVFMNIMGWIDTRTDNRRFRIAHVEIPRGSGKSLIASQACLYFLSLDNPKGNEISVAATKNEQARIVLDSARAMASGFPAYLRETGTEVLAHKIVHKKSNSFVRALSSDSKSLDGLNDVLCVIDELHAIDRGLFDVIYSGLSKRNDSLLLCITTAGFDMEGIGHSQSSYAKKVCTGEVIDDQMFAIVYTVDEGDDIFDERTWYKANPNLGVSVDPITFRAKMEKAKVTPSDLNNIKTKHLDIWVSEAKSYYDQNKWDECADPTLKLEDFIGQKCFVGLDLASKIDLASIFYVFRKDGKYYFFDRTYCPEERVKGNVLYENNVASGHLIQTTGEAIFLPKMQDDLLEFSKKHKIVACHFDPWNATEFAQRMSKERINMVEFRMNTASLSEPTKSLDALMRQKKIVHNGSPLLRWCIGNIVCKEDASSNVFPKKSHERLKIDPIIACLMALAGWLAEEQNESVYEQRGLRIL